MRFVTLSIAWQVDEHQPQSLVVTKRLKLLFPRVYVTAKAMNKANGLFTFAPCFVVYADAVVDGHIL